MARVNPEKIIDHLGHELRRALEKAVKDTIPGAEFDAATLFKAFTREVGKSCSPFEQVPDSCIQM
jgi:hypothetical protein